MYLHHWKSEIFFISPISSRNKLSTAHVQFFFVKFMKMGGKGEMVSRFSNLENRDVVEVIFNEIVSLFH